LTFGCPTDNEKTPVPD